MNYLWAFLYLWALPAYFLVNNCREEKAEKLEIGVKYYALLAEYNSLFKRINAKGGEDFLQSSRNDCQFNKDDLRTLLILCHPDKHGGSGMATEITKTINRMRKNE